MGGANTQLQSLTPQEEAKQAATYSQLEKQGMSGMADESPEHYARMAKSLYGDLKSTASRLISPNLFGRDVSSPASADTTQNK